MPSAANAKALRTMQITMAVTPVGRNESFMRDPLPMLLSH